MKTSANYHCRQYSLILHVVEIISPTPPHSLILNYRNQDYMYISYPTDDLRAFLKWSLGFSSTWIKLFSFWLQCYRKGQLTYLPTYNLFSRLVSDFNKVTVMPVFLKFVTLSIKNAQQNIGTQYTFVELINIGVKSERQKPSHNSGSPILCAMVRTLAISQSLFMSERILM